MFGMAPHSQYGLALITPPTAEPVTVDEIKRHLRYPDTDDENDTLAAFITAAREYVETVTGRQIMTATWAVSFNGFSYPHIRLPKYPLQSVQSVTYWDGTGAQVTLDSSQYQVVTAVEPGLIAPAPLTVWPITMVNRLYPVTISIVAGYTTVPERVKLAIKLLVGHLNENRETTAEQALTEIPYGLRAFINTLSPGEMV